MEDREVNMDVFGNSNENVEGLKDAPVSGRSKEF